MKQVEKQVESVIYIAGLGDRHARGQKRLLPFLWRAYGFHTEYHPITWADVDFEQKLAKIGDRIEQLTPLGRVSLVGSSAGASAVLNLYARHPNIHRVVTVCGKIQHPETIKPKTLAENPNFEASLDMLPASLRKIDEEMRDRILCIRPLSDSVVPIEDAVLEGAHEHTNETNGHAKSIAHALTIGSKTIADFIRQE